jgi:hypothetical protein
MITIADVEMRGGHPHIFTAPPGQAEEVNPLQVLITTAKIGDKEIPCIEIPWKPNEVEMMDLVNGGTIWLTIWATHLSPMAMAVQPK